MIRTIFLDAAGTLIEPAEPVAAVYARHFSAAGWPVGETEVKGAFRHVFSSAGSPGYASFETGDLAEQAWWRTVVSETARQCGIDPAAAGFEATFQRLFAHYASGAAWGVFPEVRGCLDRLRAAGYRLAVVSNFDLRLHRILQETGLAGYFEAIVTSAGSRTRKPDSLIFTGALRMLGAGTGETVHIGDSADADGRGAAAAGIRWFLLDRPGTTLQAALSWIESEKGAK